MASPNSSITKQCVVRFFLDLLAMLRVLAVEPIEDDSGRQEIVYRPGSVRTYADMQNEIATRLATLPNFTARIKMDTIVPQNPGKKCQQCGVQNNSGAKCCGGCGAQLSAPNEYIITTLKPTGAIGHKQLDQRI